MSEPHTPDREDKLEAGSLTAASPFLRWLDNFWYHYKWTVIVVTFFVVVAIVCIVQMVTRPSYDTSMVFASTYRMDNEERAAFEDLIARFCPEDFNEDGEKKVNLVVYQVYSEAEYEAEAESYAAMGDDFEINRKYNSDEYNNLNNYVLTGETSVYVLSPYLYGILRDGNRLKSLSDLYPDGDLPAGALSDGYGVALSETDFYKYNPAAQVLPENCILCVLAPTVFGGSSDEEVYADALAFFHAIADYAVKE